MNRILGGHSVVLGFVAAMLACAAGADAQDRQRSAPQRIMPVRVVTDIEIETEVELLGSSANRLLERREKEISDAIWKVDARTTITPTAISVRNLLNTDERRLGARLDIYSKAEGAQREDRSIFVLDLAELKQLDDVMAGLLRALSQSMPEKGEVCRVRYVTKTGFVASLTMDAKGGDMVLTASVGGVEVDSKEKAARLFEDCRKMARVAAQYVSGM